MANNMVASRAFMALRAEGAEEFKTLPDLAGKLDALSKIQKDFTEILWGMRPRVEAVDETASSWRLVSRLKGSEYLFREHAYEQYAARIGFPADTLTKCPMALAEQNLNWFGALKAEDKLFVRTEGDAIRAVLSEGYREVSHREIVGGFIGSSLPYEVNWAGLTPKRMFILAVDPQTKWDGPDGSQLNHCTFIGNSETGEGRMFGGDLWYDRICENRII